MIREETIQSFVEKDEVEDLLKIGDYRVLKLKTPKSVVTLLNESMNEWCTKVDEYAENYIVKNDSLILVLLNMECFALGCENSKELKSTQNRVIGAKMAKSLQESGILDELRKNGILNAGIFPKRVSLKEEAVEIARENERYADFRTIFFHLTPRKNIVKCARWAFYFALTVVRNPFPKGEPAILRSALYSYLYARYVIEGRFIDGEKKIMSSEKYGKKYLDLLTRLGYDKFTIGIVENINRDKDDLIIENEIEKENETVEV